MLDPTWLSRKHTFCHITLRDLDIPQLSVKQLIHDLQRLHIDIATFFAGGYVTAYPSALPWARPYEGLQGRDLFGEILREAKRANITVIPCIDIGEIPMHVAQIHPELAARTTQGTIWEKSSVTAQPCSLGTWVRDVAGHMLDELKDRYQIEAIKWAGASNNGTPMGCQCLHCQERYLRDTGVPLPSSGFTTNQTYTTWRAGILEEHALLLRKQSEARGLTVVGNLVWHLGRSKADICTVSSQMDITQIEVQSRYYHWMNGQNSEMCWERFGMAAESTRYASLVAKNPPWVIASYFCAWPWRWAGVPAAEQYLYLAQVLAHGGSPGVNFTTGAPHQHYDQRGMQAIENLFGLFHQHQDLFQGDRSAAEIAIIYDHASAKGDLDKNLQSYMAELGGIQEICDRFHLPYDLISADRHHDIDPQRHRVILIPDAQYLSATNAAFFLGLRAQGVGLVWTGAPGIHSSGETWVHQLGVESRAGEALFLKQEEAAPPQAYARVVDKAHPLLHGIESQVLAMADRYWPCRLPANASTPLSRVPTFRLFPEGRAYPDIPHSEDALALMSQDQVYFPFRPGLLAEKIMHPDHARLVVNAMLLVSKKTVKPLAQGKPGLRFSRRRTASGQELLHVINITGHHRFLDEYTPLYQVAISVPQAYKALVHVQSGDRIPVKDGTAIIPTLTAYDLLLCEESA